MGLYARHNGNAPGTRPRRTPRVGLREPHESVKGIQAVSDNDLRVIFSLGRKNPDQGAFRFGERLVQIFAANRVNLEISLRMRLPRELALGENTNSE